METWAHGQDVVDALGVERAPTARLRHVAEIGVRTRGFVYASRGHDGARRAGARDAHRAGWRASGSGVPTDAADWSAGDALDWCLVVTQRRNPADTDLVVEGDAAREWIGIAQAFAAPHRRTVTLDTGGRPMRSASMLGASRQWGMSR